MLAMEKRYVPFAIFVRPHTNTLQAAGVTSLIKVLMMMRERRIPTQPGLPFKLNHHFPKLDSLHVRIAGISGKDLTLRPSPASDNGKIKCLVNSFDASGGNTSLVIEEPPEQLKKQENPLPCHVVTISARTNASLKANRRKLADYLTRNPQTKLADLAYTTTARRMHEVLRVAYTAKSTREITNLLREDVKKEANDPKSKPPAMNMVFAFTGQGSQYAGMGKALFQHSSVYRDLLQTYQHMAEHQGLPNFLHLISDEEVDITAASAVCVQLAVVSLEIATAQLLKMWGVKPSMVMGHSLGEYSALCVAGVLSVSDTLFLVGRRAQLMEERLTTGQYAMLAIGKDLESVQQLLAADSTAKWGKTEVSCINAPQVTVVSGPLSEVQALKAKLETEGSRATVLRVPYGFHSAHIDPILGDFEAVAKAVVFSAPTTPVASTLLGQVVDAGQPGVFSASYLMRQARRCVNFVGALQAYQECDLAKLNTFWVEIGPDPICIGLVRRTLNVPANRLLPTMKAADDSWMTLNSTLATLYQAGAPINWPQYHKEFQNSVTLIPLPTYAFDEKDFWTPYVERVDPTLAASLNAMNSEKLLQQSLKPPPPTFSTTSLQRVEDEDIQDQTISVTFASHTSEPSLYQAIQGHVVNGLTICSLSIFCDMAKSASQYAYQKLKKSTKVPNMNVFDIDMTHALVVPRLDPDQIVKTKVSYCSAGNAADITFHSIQNGITTEHGSCKIVFEESRAWFSQLSQTSFLVDARIQALKEMSGSGKAHKLLKPVIYKLFDNLVSYSKVYQGLEEVWIDLQCRDAVGTVKLPNTTGAGNFLHNPFWTDAAVHLAGFLLNGSLKYPEDIACLSTGFESWRTLEELQADEIYTTYVSMQDAETPNVLFGSAYVYNSQQKLVQATTGIKFQKMKKVVLNTVLRPNSAPIAPAIRIEKAVAWPRDLISSNKALKPSASGVNTPATQLSDYFSNHDQSGSTSTSPSSVSDNEHPSLDLYKTLLYIVASESGCGEEELQPNTSFADVGMDSLMAITILATFQRDTGVELPATFFLDHQTVDEAKEALPGKAELVSELCEKVQEEYENGTADPTAIVPTVLEAPATPEFLEPQINIKEEPKPAPLNFNSAPAIEAPISQETTKLSKVVLLNGSASSTGRKLFLFPDGSGSPSRYIQLPALGDDVNVYGLESPFLKSPTDYTCSVEAMCNSFITVLKTTQPMGPYLLGGYSLGAIYAYEIAFRLLKDGEQVDGLFVVDMGVPKALAAPITPSQDQVSAAGLLPSTGRLTNAQKDHYISTIRAMTAYRPAQCLPNQRPKKTVLLSSKSGLAAGKQSDLAQWAQGLSAASRGWEHLVGSVEVREVDAAHFELCRYPAVSLLIQRFHQ
jgi:iterative type I PKS product template protein